jgi:hypothetical protein
VTLPYSGPPLDLNRLLEVLTRHDVEFVVIGGSAAGFLGASRLTEDADCVVRRERANLDNLASALRELHARLRVARMSDEEAKALPIQVDGVMLETTENSTWTTDAGPFDILAELKDLEGRSVPYEELLTRSMIVRGDGFSVTLPLLTTSLRRRPLLIVTRTAKPFPSSLRFKSESALKTMSGISSRSILKWMMVSIAALNHRFGRNPREYHRKYHTQEQLR